MKEKILGALLALAPFKGNAQEAKILAQDKVVPKIEQLQEKPDSEVKLDDKKNAQWEASLEMSVSLFKQSEDNPENILKHTLESDKNGQAMVNLSNSVFDNCVTKNTLYKEIISAEENNDLGSNTQMWKDYKSGKISATEAAQSMRYQHISPILIKQILVLDSKFQPINPVVNSSSVKTDAMLANYFSQAAALEKIQEERNDFSSGLILMDETMGSIEEKNLTVDGLIDAIKNKSQSLSYETKLGVLSFFNSALYKQYNHGPEATVDEKGLDEIIASATKYLRGDISDPQEVGVCRDYAALVSTLAKNGLGLNASVVTTARHDLVQIKNTDGITLIDRFFLANSLSGKPIVTKDDVDAALIRHYKEPTMTDLTIEAGGNKVLYENRHNNFAGLMNKLANRDNLSLRVPEFIAGKDKLDLFPRLSEAGVVRGAIEKGNVGAQAYWLRNNNQYNEFIQDMKGLNIAAYIPADFSLGKAKANNIFFANLGFYRSALDLAANQGEQATTMDMNVSLENYFRCSLNTSLTVGLIAKLADMNLELSRRGEELSKVQRFEYQGSISPFLSFEIPSSKGQGGDSRTYLCSGLDLTPHLSLPNLKNVTAAPWFQAGFEYNKQEIDLGLQLRGELQSASTRFNFESFLKSGSSQLELRTFLELYNKEFQKLTPFQNVAGIEAGIRQDLKSGQNLFLMLSAQSDGGEIKQILLNLGIKF